MSEADTSVADQSPDWLADDDDETQATQGAEQSEPAVGDEPAPQQDSSIEQPSRPRDVTGRFQRTSVTPQTPFGAPRPQPGTQTIAPPAGTPPAPATDFTYKADGREYKIPGLVVPEAQAEAVRQLLSEGMHHRTTWQQERASFQQEVTSAEQRLATQQAQVDHLTKTLVEAFQDPDKLAEMYNNWTQQGPIYLERAKQAAMQAELDSYKGRESQDFEQAVATAKQEYLWNSIERVVGEKFPGLFDETSLASTYGELSQLGLIQVADKDYPEYGYARGDVLLDEAALYGHLAKAADGRKQVQTTQQMAADKVAKVAANNAVVMNGGRKAPPVVSARTGVAPAQQKAKPVTAKDWRAWVDTDDE
jgi:hypothetical protein